MKIVFDTNVLISAFVFSGLSADVYEHCHTFHEIVVSERLITEFTRVLRRKLRVSADELKRAEALLRAGATVAETIGEEPRACRDHDDDHVLHLAVSCGAKQIISGDKDLLEIDCFRSIQILTPRRFLESLRASPRRKKR